MLYLTRDAARAMCHTAMCHGMLDFGADDDGGDGWLMANLTTGAVWAFEQNGSERPVDNDDLRTAHERFLHALNTDGVIHAGPRP